MGRNAEQMQMRSVCTCIVWTPQQTCNTAGTVTRGDACVDCAWHIVPRRTERGLNSDWLLCDTLSKEFRPKIKRQADADLDGRVNQRRGG